MSISGMSISVSGFASNPAADCSKSPLVVSVGALWYLTSQEPVNAARVVPALFGSTINTTLLALNLV